MLLSYKTLQSFDIAADDGHIGTVQDLYFDDRRWQTRYLVVNTGGWLGGRKVLLDHRHVRRAIPDDQALRVGLTQQQIEQSPEVSAHLPVSQQHEMELAQYYQLNPYWYTTGTISPGMQAKPVSAVPSGVKPVPQAWSEPPPGPEVEGHDPHLRSAEAVLDYSLHTPDDTFGEVDDFIIDTDEWILRYVVADTGDWLPGRKVLVATDWFTSVDWNEASIHTELTREQVENSPEFDPSQPVNRAYEATLFDYYGRPVYWT